MQLSTPIVILIAALTTTVSAQSTHLPPPPGTTPWSMTSWEGQACNNAAKHRLWHGFSTPNHCAKLPAGTKSLKVHHVGQCTTTYYHDDKCTGEAFLAKGKVCDGFNGGEIGSFKLHCV
ncbi:hypothetical protein F5Y19DRAFT_473091 [Xylariaceae sp. FL1651]|nr:hypothetical protein F5Y19DRAFT_473091 [Xylariaceae sp. FL1651]